MLTTMKITVIGGGPSGLCAALLLKTQHPAWDVAVFEKNPVGVTFGYGVGLRWSVLSKLAAAAPECARAIEQTAHVLNRQTVLRDGRTAGVGNDHGLGVSRGALLDVLARHAEAAGVVIRTGSPADLAEVSDADLVVAADGVSSPTRRQLAEHLGVTATTGDLAYLWCGATVPLEAMTLAIARTASGPLVAHAMPYGPESCTFQVDARTATLAHWSGAATGTISAESVSAAATVKLIEAQFADLLGGTRLHTKQPVWSTFTTIRCQKWSHGDVVLIGDAAHTAHYTVGSGTALAIEDAVALAQALQDNATIPDALGAYEAARRPYVERLQERAERSERWWSTLDTRIDLPLPQLMLSYLSRTGALTLSSVADLDRALLEQCLPDGSGGAWSQGTAELVESILTTTRRGDGSLDTTGSIPAVTVTRSAEVRAFDDQVRAVAEGLGTHHTHVRLVGSDDREAILDRLEFAERLRARTPAATIVRGPRTAAEDLALGVLCDRTDLVEIS
jgi:anthraniloyl-CoA monooxygenase